MTMPTFLMIGAARCGTDSLYSYFEQHPEVYTSVIKEPMFFVAEGQDEIPYCGPGDRETMERFHSWVNTLEQYQSLFADATTQRAIGEASTWYLYDDAAPRRIRQHVPHAKLIVILRNPVDRAYSAYTMLMRDGRETIQDFSAALTAEDERVRAGWEPMWHYQRMGLYYAQLERYYKIFDAEQIYVVLYDDFVSRPRQVVRDLFRFLEVDEQFEPDMSERLNVSVVPKYPAFHTLIAGRSPSPFKATLKSVFPMEFRQRVKAGLLSPFLVKPVPLARETRHRLLDTFESDILQLQDLIHKDLSMWLRRTH